MAEDQEERTEDATQTRRDDFRRRGQVAQSRELASTLFLIATAALLFMASPMLFREIKEVFEFTMGPNLLVLIKEGDLFAAARMAGAKALLLMGPFLFVSVLVGVGSTVLQVGFLNVEDAFTPKLEKINPIDGFNRLFTLKTLMEGVKALLKFVFIGVVTYGILKNEVSHFPELLNYNTAEILKYTGAVIFKLFMGVGIAMVVLTGADYFFLRWDLEKQMRMTKEEIKKEHKDQQGDPLIKARIRRIQKEISQRRMMDKIPKADVIITNPTHIAVALRYSSDTAAPQLIAKGADLIAGRIREIAKEHNIPIVENKPLARTIYKTMKLGQVIPRELFVAVAEVLSYVYKLKRKARKK